MDRPSPQQHDSKKSGQIQAGAGAKTKAKAGSPAHGAKVRLSVPAILDKLDSADDSRFRNRRSGDRIRFRRAAVPIKVMHPGGSTIQRTVATRNLSASGIGFLYDSFLHIGTRVTVRLVRRLGGEDALNGVVVYCAHVSGAYHQVGVRFDQKIFSKLYTAGLEQTAAEAGASSETIVQIASTLHGRLLVIDAEPMDRALLARHLHDTKLEVVAVKDMAAAVEALSAGAFEMVLSEIDFQSPEIAAVVNAIRSAGHTGTLVAAAATKPDAMRLKWADTLGIAAVLSKPYERVELITLFAKRLTPFAAGGADATDQAVRAIEKGVAEVKGLVEVCKSAK